MDHVCAIPCCACMRLSAKQLCLVRIDVFNGYCVSVFALNWGRQSLLPEAERQWAACVFVDTGSEPLLAAGLQARSHTACFAVRYLPLAGSLGGHQTH